MHSFSTVVMQKRYQDDINTEHNIKSIGRAAVAQWTKRLTRNDKREFESERRTFLILHNVTARGPLDGLIVVFLDSFS